MESIVFFGGDKRSFFLSEMLEGEFKVLRYGMNTKEEQDYDSIIEQSKYIMLPIPVSTDGENLYMPLCEKKISLEDFCKQLKNKIVLCGGLKANLKKKLEIYNEVIDVMDNESLAVKNAIPTAEGVIKTIIENTEITIDGSKIAIIGFGRVGKKIAELLYEMKSNIYCADLKQEEVANIKRCGYNVLDDICEDYKHFDVIVNTVPERILDKNKLKVINKETLIIDVASNPGGVDYEYAKINGYKCIHALGLPGKVAPKTSANYIKEVLINLLK